MKILVKLILAAVAITLPSSAYAELYNNHKYAIWSTIKDNWNIDLSNSNTSDGANIQIWPSNQTNAQRWIVKKNPDGSITLCSAINQNYVIDVSGSRVACGTNIQLWRSNGTAAQRWYPEKVPGNANIYILRSALNRNYVLDLNNSTCSAGNNIHLWEYNGSSAQKWLFIDMDANLFDFLFGD